MTQHTPGPWTVADDLKTMDCIGIYGPNNTLVAEIRDPESVKPEEREQEEQVMRANAALIGAAPDLLSALKNLTEWGRTHTSPRDANSPHTLLIAACEAIDKAEGRTA